MRVLFITHYNLMAGANRSFLQLILELRDGFGIDPYVLVPRYNGHNKTLKDRLTDNNILFKEVYCYPFKQGKSTAATRRNVVISHWKINQLAKELRPKGFDLVHSNSSVLDFGASLSRELGVKHIWHLREFGDLDYSMYCVFGKLYERLSYRNAEGFIAISDCIKNHFKKKITHRDINTIYNGIMDVANAPLATHTNTTIQFLCAGSYGEAKNQIEILQAANILANQYHISNFHITTVGIGVNNQYVQQMKQYIADHSLEGFVSILGEIDGIAELASKMDIGLMPSRNEAFGRVTVEYMLQNLAVIANDGGANTEIIEHGKSGLIYPRNDIQSLANSMRELIMDNSMLITLATNGRKCAKEKFLSSYNTKAVYRLYQDVFYQRNFSSNSISNFFCKLILSYYGICLYPLVKLNALLDRLKIR